MTSEGFAAGDWIDRLAQARHGSAEALLAGLWGAQSGCACCIWRVGVTIATVQNPTLRSAGT